jgi:hypothetical protein
MAAPAQNCDSVCIGRGTRTYAEGTLNKTTCEAVGKLFQSSLVIHPNSGDNTFMAGSGCYIPNTMFVVWYGPDYGNAILGKICSCSQ